MSVIDYTEPPVLDINNGERYVNGRWVNGRAEFPEVVNGPMWIHAVRMWLWLASGAAYPVDVVMSAMPVRPRDVITITDIDLRP